MNRIPIVGYADRFSLAPGESIAFKVSSLSSDPYSARLVRVISGDPNPQGPGIVEQDIDAAFAGTYPSRYQHSALGSCMTVAPSPALDTLQDLTIGATIWPTTPARGEQAVIGRFQGPDGSGFALMIGPNGAAALCGSGGAITRVETCKPLVERRWYRVWASYAAATGTLRVGQQPLQPRTDADDAAVAERAAVAPPDPVANQPLIVAALGGQRRSAHYNGKIERPFIVTGAPDDATIAAIAGGADHPAVVAAWDFSRNPDTPDVTDTGPNRLDGRLVNLPTRAMTGSTWDGSAFSPSACPGHYGAIHFHDDDLHDCGWDTDFRFTVPEDFRSGVYAVRVRTTAGDEDMVPFFVTAVRGRPQARICVLIPTFTYTGLRQYRARQHR